METKVEEILKRDDGTKVRITIRFYPDYNYSGPTYKAEVEKCVPKKRKWRSCHNNDNWDYRALSLDDRKKYREAEQLKVVTSEEIYQAKLKLWEKLKP